ncbi:MAG: hypothetical protein OEZ36_13520, partial [Spirochaetota bacterium]|nr:hypothetical protein [Spirochaetota bacterium]
RILAARGFSIPIEVWKAKPHPAPNLAAEPLFSPLTYPELGRTQTQIYQEVWICLESRCILLLYSFMEEEYSRQNKIL